MYSGFGDLFGAPRRARGPRTLGLPRPASVRISQPIPRPISGGPKNITHRSKKLGGGGGGGPFPGPSKRGPSSVGSISHHGVAFFAESSSASRNLRRCSGVI